MTKKITDLLELLDEPGKVYPHMVQFQDASGSIRRNGYETIISWANADHMTRRLTKLWNSLTGEDLKNVTWVI